MKKLHIILMCAVVMISSLAAAEPTLEEVNAFFEGVSQNINTDNGGTDYPLIRAVMTLGKLSQKINHPALSQEVYEAQIAQAKTQFAAEMAHLRSRFENKGFANFENLMHQRLSVMKYRHFTRELTVSFEAVLLSIADARNHYMNTHDAFDNSSLNPVDEDNDTDSEDDDADELAAAIEMSLQKDEAKKTEPFSIVLGKNATQGNPYYVAIGNTSHWTRKPEKLDWAVLGEGTHQLKVTPRGKLRYETVIVNSNFAAGVVHIYNDGEQLCLNKAAQPMFVRVSIDGLEIYNQPSDGDLVFNAPYGELKITFTFDGYEETVTYLHKDIS